MRRLMNLSNWEVLLLLTMFAAYSALLSIKADGGIISAEWMSSFMANLSTEMIGAIITFFMFNVIIGGRQERNRLIQDLGSRVNEVAIKAAEDLKAKGWLRDGALTEAILIEANLQGANLREADLQRARMQRANLQNVNLLDADLERSNLGYANLQNAELEGINLEKAILKNANLQNTNLQDANLQSANLWHANLQEANLMYSDLQGANLKEANLKGANLEEVNLKGANLEKANLEDAELFDMVCDEKTRLPNGEYWTPKIDMRMFSEPIFPNFWQPEWVKQQKADQ